MSQQRNKHQDDKPLNGMLKELSRIKVTKRDKFAWIAAGTAIVVLFLCFWARSSGQ